MSNTNQNQTPAIVMHNQYIKDFSLEIPHAPQIFQKINVQPQIKIDVNIDARHIEKNVHEVVLNFRIDGDVKDEKFFILEMAYAGVASINVPEEHKEPVLMVEIPHLLFPYARQIVSSALFDGGLPPLMLSPVDFVGMYNASKQAKASAKQ